MAAMTVRPFLGVRKRQIVRCGCDDILYGNSGNNRMTGGKGSDTFVFNSTPFKDVITDFNANGGGNAQDHLDANGSGYTLVKHGKDVLVDFVSGSTVILLDVCPRARSIQRILSEVIPHLADDPSCPASFGSNPLPTLRPFSPTIGVSSLT